MSNFYDLFSKHYFEIFKPNKNTIDLILSNINGNKILDVACGTGEYSSMLFNYNDKLEIDAFDLSENMIINARRRHKNINFYVFDMKEYKKDNFYNFIYCIGSSIAHLNNETEIKNFITNMINSLVQGGKLLIQTLDYSYMRENGIYEMDTLYSNTKDISLTRKYKYNQESVIFETTLKINNESYDDKTKLLLVSKQMFIDILSKMNNIDFIFLISSSGRINLLVTKK